MQSGLPQSNQDKVRRALCAVVMVFLIAAQVFAASRAIRMAWSDRLASRDSSEAVERAVALEPASAQYRLRLADLLETSGEDPRPALRDALLVKRDDCETLIRLGLLEEAGESEEQAEALLRDAARVSRKYLPRWTLANFYFRRGESAQFRRWAREALAVSYGDRTPLFRLCWEMAPDPRTILREAIPEARTVRLAWLQFLTGREVYPEAAALAGELAAEASEPEATPLLGVADALLRAGDYRGALGIWNPLCVRQVIPSPEIDPVAGNVVTNGDFARPTLARGFDWRIPRIEGVFVTQAPGRWNIALTGVQPERRDVLSQPVALSPGKTYRFSSRYRSRASGPVMESASSGLRWRLRTTGGQVLAESDELVIEGEGEASFQVLTPKGVTGALLVLYHDRASGSIRMAGSVELEQVRLESL